MTQRVRGGVLLALIACAAMQAAAAQGAAQAQGAAPPQHEPVGQPKPEGALRDADFGVATRQFGLERTVEMYQWHRAGQGYFAGWSLEAVDSTGFAPGHANPGKFPLQGRQWRALSVTLDGKPVAADVVARLGEWRSFRPNFSALPGNLSATFQPEGDGLGSAENPLDPQVGDLRVTWRELVLPPLQGRIVLRDGEWLLPDAPATAVAPAEESATTNDTRISGSTRWIVAGGLLVILATALAYRRRKRKQATEQPSP